MMNSIHDALYWRYAAKEFDSTAKLTNEERDTILEAIRLAPTSYGLQPFRVVVVTNPDVRTKLRAVSFDQSKVTDADTFLVFCARTNVSPADTQEYIDRTMAVRGVDAASLEGFKGMINGTIASMNQEQSEAWAARQAYIALGFGLETAAIIGVDACPMEGFDAAQYNEILGLSAQGLSAKAAMAIGRRNPTDAYATYKKVRLSDEAMFLRA